MTAPVAPQPVAGPTFRAAARVDVGGRRRRRLFALLGAYADAGQHSPTVEELADRLAFKPRSVLALLLRLEADGHLTIDRRQPNRYTLTLPEAGERS